MRLTGLPGDRTTAGCCGFVVSECCSICLSGPLCIVHLCPGVWTQARQATSLFVPELWLLLPSQGSQGDTPQVLQNVLSSSWYLEASVGDRQFVYVMRFVGERPHLCLWTHMAVCGPGFPDS